jgi:5-methylcytosine-specific restriction enzyme A
MASSRLMAAIRLDWTREEIILAMVLYVTAGALNGGSIPGKTSPQVTALSALLKRLNAYPIDQQGDNYRNPDGVYLKLTNLRAIETEGQHGMNAYSQLDAAVWRDYEDDLEALHAEAEAIRRRLSEGTLQESAQTPTAEDVDIEKQHTERFLVTPNGEPRPAERA